MREAGVWVRYRRRFRVTTDSDHRKLVYPNRLRETANWPMRLNGVSVSA